MEFTAVAWNLFHGRDFPPDRRLFTWRSRLLGVTERNETHAQVNRDLLDEFATILSSARWDVALLQECPPRFADRLASACGAEAHRALTSRNSFGRLRAAAARINPDLIASGEGGSNLTLVRPTGPGCNALSTHDMDNALHPRGLGGIVERRELAIHEGRPERRAMAFTRTASGLCIANLHATNDQPRLAAEDLLLAAHAATNWAEGRPLLFGGDLNLRPAEDPEPFAELHDRFGFDTPVTAPGAIDHLLGRGLKAIGLPSQWTPEQREVNRDGRAIRLSDHSPVEAMFATAETQG
ncbi:MAG TPA: endonuclease/exonuclease/phosphatase family protein [Solirubrobacterales bacterium]